MRLSVVPGKDVDSEKGFTSAFIVHPLHELANTFFLQNTLLIIAKEESWLFVRDASFSPVAELVPEVQVERQEQKRH
jgi:hypothetical protein